MQTRSFNKYQISSLVAFTHGVTLFNMDGYYSGTGGEWLQIFDLAAAPSVGTVPLKSYACLNANYIPGLALSMGIKLRNGLVFAISSTEGTYTASSSKFDIVGEVEEWETSLTDLKASSVTGSAQFLQVVAEASGPATLLQIDFSTAVGRAASTKRWLVVFADDAMTKFIGSYKLFTSTFSSTGDLATSVTNTDTLTLSFGLTGHSFSPSGKGLSIAYSSSPTSNVAPAGESCTLIAYYL